MKRNLTLDPPRMRWHREPAEWSTGRDGTLSMKVEPDTDFWQRTHYGFQRDNGHLLGHEVAGDFRCEAAVHTAPSHQYDQAGLMLRFASDCWVKTSIEFEPEGPSRLGVVVTNGGWSDWSTQDVPQDMTSVMLRMSRTGDDITVEWRGESRGRWSQMRVAHLDLAGQRRPGLVGIYACAPTGPGFEAEFSGFSIELPAPD